MVLKFKFSCEFCRKIHSVVFIKNSGLPPGSVGMVTMDPFSEDVSSSYTYECPNDEDKKTRTVSMDFTDLEKERLKSYRYAGVEKY